MILRTTNIYKHYVHKTVCMYVDMYLLNAENCQLENRPCKNPLLLSIMWNEVALEVRLKMDI